MREQWHRLATSNAMKPANKVVRRSNIPVPQIERHIYTIRGQRVMLDRDLAKLYDVRPTALRQQVKRNPDRFPKDFTFQLKAREAELLVSQNVTPNGTASADTCLTRSLNRA
jgi:hypothetical protein